MKKSEFEEKTNLEKHKVFTTVENADEEFLKTSSESLNELIEMCGEGNDDIKNIFSEELNKHEEKLKKLKKIDS